MAWRAARAGAVDTLSSLTNGTASYATSGSAGEYGWEAVWSLCCRITQRYTMIAEIEYRQSGQRAVDFLAGAAVSKMQRSFDSRKAYRFK